VIVSGGMREAEHIRWAFEYTGAEAIMLARGSLGNPWLFEQVLGMRRTEPSATEVLHELDWVLECAVEHLGVERAAHYLRKFYPWYVERLGGGKALQAALQTAPTLEAARTLFWETAQPRAA
jgi:tRNA-dihydrouridine synthase